MSCQDFLPLISAAVDNQLTASEYTWLEEHLKACPNCRNEFELEQMTKTFVRQRLVRVTTPAAVAERVRQQLVYESSRRSTWLERLDELLPQPSWRTVLATAAIGSIVLLAVMLFVPTSRHSHPRPVDNNIIHQTYNNFDDILEGKLVPTVTSNNPVEVESTLSLNLDFEVRVPRLKRCTLVGGSFTNYRTEKIAHLLYKYDNDLIYLYQTHLAAIEEKGVLNLPEQAMNELHRSGRYIENHMDDCSLILWIEGTTVSVAVANMDEKTLLDCLNDCGERQ